MQTLSGDPEWNRPHLSDDQYLQAEYRLRKRHYRANTPCQGRGFKVNTENFSDLQGGTRNPGKREERGTGVLASKDETLMRDEKGRQCYLNNWTQKDFSGDRDERFG